MLVQALRRFWLLACVVLLAALGSVVVAVAELPSRSTATAVVSVDPRPGTTASAALITLLSTKYVAFASSPALAERVARETQVAATAIDGGLEVTMPERTTTIRIAMTADTAEDAAAVTEAVSTAVVQRSNSDRYLLAEVVVPAEADSATERSGRVELLPVGIAGAVVLAVGVAVLAQLVARARARRRGVDSAVRV
jgi:capsular polysaccharide biosynthesis protein